MNVPWHDSWPVAPSCMNPDNHPVSTGNAPHSHSLSDWKKKTVSLPRPWSHTCGWRLPNRAVHQKELKIGLTSVDAWLKIKKVSVICQCLLETWRTALSAFTLLTAHSQLGELADSHVSSSQSGPACLRDVRLPLIGWATSWLLVFCWAQTGWGAVLRVHAALGLQIILTCLFSPWSFT